VRSDALGKTEVCPYCGERQPNTLDHIRAQKQDWVEGGWADDYAARTARINDRDNLVGACGSCNSSKRDLPIGLGEGEWWPPGWGPNDLWPFGGP
jgi:5-methylcytosine-specific restriction endonuclease McrA